MDRPHDRRNPLRRRPDRDCSGLGRFQPVATLVRSPPRIARARSVRLVSRGTGSGCSRRAPTQWGFPVVEAENHRLERPRGLEKDTFRSPQRRWRAGLIRDVLARGHGGGTSRDPQTRSGAQNRKSRAHRFEASYRRRVSDPDQDSLHGRFACLSRARCHGSLDLVETEVVIGSPIRCWSPVARGPGGKLSRTSGTCPHHSRIVSPVFCSSRVPDVRVCRTCRRLA